LEFWKGKKVLITGGTGFIGSHLVDLLVEKGAIVRVTTRNKNSERTMNNLSESIEKIELLEADLEIPSDCQKAIQDINVVFHLAAIVEESKQQNKKPASVLKNNNLMTLNILEAITKSSVERTTILSSACVYPENIKGLIKEETKLDGNPDESKFAYSWSKRFDEIYAKVFAEQYGLKIGIARPFNVYGPRVKTHVIPSIILQIMAKNSIIIYGDGQQERSFIYVTDLVKGLLMQSEKYPKTDPINFGSNQNITINELAKKIASVMNKKIKIEHNPSVNPGSLTRLCDTAKAEKIFGFKTETSLEEGLEKTIDWLGKN